MPAVGARINIGPIGKTAIIVIGGGLAGGVLAGLAGHVTTELEPIHERLAAAAGASAVAYLVTRDATTTLIVAGIGAVAGIAGEAAKRTARLSPAAGVLELAAVVAGTYLAVR